MFCSLFWNKSVFLGNWKGRFSWHKMVIRCWWWLILWSEGRVEFYKLCNCQRSLFLCRIGISVEHPRRIIETISDNGAETASFWQFGPKEPWKFWVSFTLRRAILAAWAIITHLRHIRYCLMLWVLPRQHCHEPIKLHDLLGVHVYLQTETRSSPSDVYCEHELLLWYLTLEDA